MDLRKLKSFLVVAKELHFGKAAKKLNITQPALTHQIKQLENELGYEIFDKAKRDNNRKVELTETGAYLVKEVSRVFDLLERTLKNAKLNDEKSKQLKLGVPKICLTSEVVDVLEHLNQIFPDTTFNVIEFSNVISVQEALFKGNIDIGITTLPLAYNGIDYHLIRNEFLDVVLPTNHPLAKYQKIKIEQLRNDKWVELNKDLCLQNIDEIEMYCRNVGFSRDVNIVQEVSNADLLVGLVKAKIGIAIFPSHFLNNLEGIISKKIFFSDDTRLKIEKIIAFKKSFDPEYLALLKKHF